MNRTPIKQLPPYKAFLVYLLKFGGAFCLFYFGTLAVIGLSSPENSYNAFVARHLNFIQPLRHSLLSGAHALVSLFGYAPFFRDEYTLAINGDSAVRMVYSCVGYGVMSFWAAFVLANKGHVLKKTLWLIGGWAALWAINVGRIALLLMAARHRWAIPLGWDHHTWFNIVAYALIFGMIYFYDRSLKQTETRILNNNANQNIQALS